MFTLGVDHWSYQFKKDNTPKPETVNIQNQIIGGISLYKNEKFQFIKERYIFQLVRLYYFNNNYKKSIQFFKKHFLEIKLTDSMKWRTMGYAAAAYTNSNKIGTANYLYSQIYANSPILKNPAYFSFRPMEEEDWQKSLKLAKNNEEKIVLWYLFGKHFDVPRALKEIHTLNPNSKYLKLLLVFAIKSKNYSIFENRIWYKDYKNPKSEKISPLNDKHLLEIVISIVNQDRVKNKFGWKIAAAYLNYLSLNFKEGDHFLESAFKLKGNVEVFEKQYQITSLLGKLLRMDSIDEKLEISILPEIKFLFSKNKNISEDSNLKFPREWVRRLLAVWYARKGELEKAEWIQSGIIEKHFRNSENIKKMVDFIEDNNHSPLIQVMLQNPIYSYNDYLLLLAVFYSLEENLDSSLQVFDKILISYKHDNPENSLSHPFYKNPFRVKIKDRYNSQYYKKGKVKYNHETFIKEMIRLKKDAETNPSNPSKKYFKLANAYYNMNYFAPFNFTTLDDDWYYSWNGPQNEVYFLLINSFALKYYLLARENSKNKEFKAKMTFMAAKCEQNTWYIMKVSKSRDGFWLKDAKDFQPGKYFQELRDIYSDTKYHSEIIKECSYYARYYAKKSEL